MNGKRAKAIAKQAFEASKGKPSKYRAIKYVKLFFVNRAGKSRPKKRYRYTLVWEGYRRIYKDLKKEYKHATSRSW